MSRSVKTILAALAALNLLVLGLLLGGRNGAAQTRPGGGTVAAPLGALDPTDRIFAIGSTGKSLRRTSVVEAAEKVSPSVVSVSAVSKQVVRAVDPFFSNFFDFGGPLSLFEREIPTLGSGLIVSADGYILTNHHVVEGASIIRVSLPDRREFAAQLVDADSYVDIAVLKVKANDLPAAQLGKSDDLMIGEWVLAVGNPFGAFEEDPRPSVSVGVVSATNRFFRPGGEQGAGSRYYQNMIQTDAAINPGNSGGPLANILGQVIGLNAFIVSNSGGSSGVGFAIPIDRAAAVYEEVRSHGHVRSLRVDFRVLTLNRQIARHLGLPGDLKGAIVSEILEENGPAAQAGLRLGDVIVREDTKPIRSEEDLWDYYRTLQVGAKVEFEVVRDGKRLALSYTVREGR